MNENHIHHAAPPRPEQIEFLKSFYISPGTELGTANIHDGRGPVVVKRLSMAYRGDPAQRERFRSEYVYLQSLDHPGISKPESILDTNDEVIQIHAPGSYATIGQLMGMCKRQERRLPIEIGLFTIEQILHALRHLFEDAVQNDRTGMDVSLHPDSLLVDEEGRTLISTIGLSDPPYITSSILGSGNKSYFVYAAPEQCVAGRVPDKRVCFYTLGVLCYELLTGKPLFSRSTRDDLDAVVRRKLRRLHPLTSDVDPLLADIDELVMSLLDPVPENRETDLDLIAKTIARLHRYTGRCTTNEVASYRIELERTGDGSGGKAGDITDQLSAVTDITEYNAS